MPWQRREKNSAPRALAPARKPENRAAVDGRSLRVTGRTEQFNFKCREDIKRRAVEAAREDGVAIAEWMERTIEAALKVKGA
jgi:hypothetical protein